MKHFSYQFNIPRWLVLLIDIEIVLIGYVLSNFILNSFLDTFSIENLLYQIPIVIIVYLFTFIYFKTYKGIIKKTGLKDTQNLFISNLIAFIILFAIAFVFREFLMDYFIDNKAIIMTFRLSYSIIFVHSLITTIVMVNSRIYYKWIHKYFLGRNKKTDRVLIYGAGDSGYITRDILENETQQIYKVIGFIDDNPSKKGKRIDGLKVFSIDEITHDYILQNNISQIIISIHNTSNSELIELSQSIEDLPVEIKIIPPISQWIDGTYQPSQIRQLRIEDLLGRECIELNNPIINEEFKNKTVFVTGAAGSIGSEISKQISTMDFDQLILIDQAESALYDVQQSLKYSVPEVKQKNIHYIVASIRDQLRMYSLFEEFKPHLIFHAAAYKHVPLMESFPYEAINTNIQGTKIIADLAHKFKANKFVMISTDKAVNPTNVMGATKRVAEIYVNSINKNSTTNYIVTRFGNVLGSNGSVIPLFKKQLEKGGPLTVTDANITRYFMTIPEACNLVLEAGVMGKGGEIFVFDMGKSIRIFDLAKKMIQLSGFKYPQDIDIKVIGLRPGEKIYEELLADDENTIKTHHEKIMIAKVNTEKLDENKIMIEELCDISSSNENNNATDLVARMKQIVPEFKSQNSEFQKLDYAIYKK